MAQVLRVVHPTQLVEQAQLRAEGREAHAGGHR